MPLSGYISYDLKDKLTKRQKDKNFKIQSLRENGDEAVRIIVFTFKNFDL